MRAQEHSFSGLRSKVEKAISRKTRQPLDRAHVGSCRGKAIYEEGEYIVLAKTATLVSGQDSEKRERKQGSTVGQLQLAPSWGRVGPGASDRQGIRGNPGLSELAHLVLETAQIP